MIALKRICNLQIVLYITKIGIDSNKVEVSSITKSIDISSSIFVAPCFHSPRTAQVNWTCQYFFFLECFITVDLDWSCQPHQAGRREGSSPLKKKYEFWWTLVKSWRLQGNAKRTLISGTGRYRIVDFKSYRTVPCVSARYKIVLMVNRDARGHAQWRAVMYTTTLNCDNLKCAVGLPRFLLNLGLILVTLLFSLDHTQNNNYFFKFRKKYL